MKGQATYSKNHSSSAGETARGVIWDGALQAECHLPKVQGLDPATTLPGPLSPNRGNLPLELQEAGATDEATCKIKCAFFSDPIVPRPELPTFFGTLSCAIRSDRFEGFAVKGRDSISNQ